MDSARKILATMNPAETMELIRLQSHVTYENVNGPGRTSAYASSLSCSELHLVARCGLESCIRWLVKERGADIEVRDYRGETPLFDAVINDQGPAVELLLQLKAMVNVTNRLNLTPLHFACNGRNSGIAKVLILAGANQKCSGNKATLSLWLKNVIAHCNCKRTCIAMIGIRNKRVSILNTNVRDIAKIIVKYVWSTRNCVEMWDL